MWAALHPCLRRAGSPVDGLWPTRCEPCRHRTARFDRLGESGRLKIDRDDTLSDGSARDSATRRSRPRVETRPIDSGRASLETEPDDRVPRCGREAPPFTAGEDVTLGGLLTSRTLCASPSCPVRFLLQEEMKDTGFYGPRRDHRTEVAREAVRLRQAEVRSVSETPIRLQPGRYG